MHKLIILFALIISLGSCEREPIEVITNTETVIKPPSAMVHGNITGVILDQENKPLPSVLIEVGMEETLTADDGSFLLSGVELFEDGTLISASKAGYFTGFSKYYAEDGDTKRLELRLVKKEVLETVSSSSGGTVTFGAAEVQLPSGIYATEQDQSSHVGNINVFGRWLDPTLKSSFLELPGDLTGFDAEGQLSALSVFSLVHLEITNDNDQSLSMPEGKQAQITMPVAPSLLDFAPPMVQLSYYSESDGFWLAEGTAELIGDSYVAQVSRSEHWMANLFSPLVEVSGTVTIDENLASNREIKITSTVPGYTAYVTATESATFKERLPGNVSLELTTIDDCKGVEVTRLIGPFANSVDGVNINYTFDFSMAQASGSVSNCSSADNSQKFIRLAVGDDNFIYRTNNSGKFDIPIAIPDCRISTLGVFGLAQNASDSTSFFSSDLEELAISDNISGSTLEACKSIPGGYHVDYEGIDWADELHSQVRHQWKVHKISSSPATIIFDINIMDDITGEIYLSGAIVFNEGTTEGDFLLESPHQGLVLEGTCNILTENHEDFDSYVFQTNQSKIEITDQNLAPPSLTEMHSAEFRLVYYD